MSYDIGMKTLRLEPVERLAHTEYCSNDALARAFAYELSRELEASVRISLSDDAFLLAFPDFVELEGIGEMLDPDDLEATLRRAIRNTEIFAQRFRHCANRSFMVLRNYKGREISLPRQQLRTSQVLEAIHELPNFPMLDEAYREVLHDAFDLKHAREVLTDIASGERSVSYRPYSAVPSPLAHGVILSGMSDIVLMEDRSALLRELHTQVLGRVLEQEGGDKARFEHELVDGYFNEKAPLVDSPEGVLQAIRETGGLALLADRRRSVYRLSELPTSGARGGWVVWGGPAGGAAKSGGRASAPRGGRPPPRPPPGWGPPVTDCPRPTRAVRQPASPTSR